MFVFKKKYLLIIETTKDIDLKNIKKTSKFIVIYRNLGKKEKIDNLNNFRRVCRSKKIKFFIANDFNLARSIDADGIYLSASNRSLKIIRYKKNNFLVIGSAHDYKDINLKEKQGCKIILLSKLFHVSYKPNESHLGIHRFNSFVVNFSKKIIPLGGINNSNLNKLKIIKSEGLAILSEIKKKPAKSISRLL